VSESLALALMALSQGVFLSLLILLVLVNRARTRTSERRRAAAAADVAEPLHRWLTGGGTAVDVGAALARMAPHEALEQVILVSSRVAPAQLDALTRVLRGRRWVARILARARSPFWWHRLEATRFLAVVTLPTDRFLVRQLLADPHPGVQAAATDCLTRLGDANLIAYVLDRLAERPAVIRLFQAHVLRGAWRQAVPALLKRLRMRAPPAQLEVWIQLAETLGDPKCLAAACTLHGHPDSRVRIAAVRALRRYPHPDAAEALAHRMVDGEWRVRAEAARALGAIGGASSIPLLVAALADRAWSVRFRAALALAELGEPGRQALVEATTLPDRYARDMAAMVSALSDGHRAELVEA
jgi:HEAT repeat protein